MSGQTPKAKAHRRARRRALARVTLDRILKPQAPGYVQAVYRLDRPQPWDGPGLLTHVYVSAVPAFGRWETKVFPCDGESVLSWDALGAVLDGGHAAALRRARFCVAAEDVDAVAEWAAKEAARANATEAGE